MKKKVALITGITGQDGSYLAEFLLKKKYEVIGLKRRSSLFNTDRIDHLYIDPLEKKTNFKLFHSDMNDGSSIFNLINNLKPDEVYNLAAQSHVKVSFEIPEYTANSDALGALRFLEAIKSSDRSKKIKFYQASTSEMYGNCKKTPQNEKTVFKPDSPYAAAKLYAHNITKIYREAYGIFACTGILFNHESPRRGETFVTKKIVKGLAEIKYGKKKRLSLGNLDAKRDWGHAKDYIEMQWLMLQQDEPDDYVIATGRTETIKKFIEISAKKLNWNKDINRPSIIWEGEGLNEIGRRADTNEIIIRVDARYFRPAEVDLLIGDSTKAFKNLNWKPKISLEQLIEEMIDEDKKKAFNEKLLSDNGINIES